MGITDAKYSVYMIMLSAPSLYLGLVGDAENAGLENSGPKCRGGKRRTGKRETT